MRDRQRSAAARTAAVVAAAGMLAAPAAARAATPTTNAWTGAAASSSTYPTLGDWANGGNWSSGAFADGDALSFGFLSGCGGASACYTAEATPLPKTSTPDALSAPSLTIGDDLPYDLLAQQYVGLTLDPPSGTNGITATPSGARLGSPSIIVPLTLGDSQQWSVAGNGAGAGALSVLSVDGAPNTLGLSLTGGASVFFTGLLQTGGLTATGGGAATPAANGTLALSTPTGNPTSPVTVQHVALTLGAYAGTTVGIGALSVQSSALTIGDAGPNGPGATQAGGAVAIDSGSTTTVQLAGVGGSAGSAYGQLAASGAVSVAGQLSLVDVGGTAASCPADPVGSVDTLISAGGGLSGRFANLPDGAITSITARCGATTERYPLAIHYTPSAVTATFLAPSATSTSLSAAPATVVSGSNVTLTATVAAGAAGAALPTGSVQFLDGGTPITCGSGGALTASSPVTATCSARLSPGVHTIHAVYGGDGAWAGSSATTTVNVVRPLDGFPRMGRPRVRARRVAVVPVTCTRGGGDCAIRLALDTERTVHHGKRFISRTVTLGQTRRTIDSGVRRVVTVTLNAAGRRALARTPRGRLTVELVLERIVARHRYRVGGRNLVLRRPAPRHHR